MADASHNDKMSIFEVDCTRVALAGVILSGHLTLHNPHQMLAVIFELEAVPTFLQIEPIRGMIMQGQRKIIRLRCKAEARSSLGKIQAGERRLIIRGSYYSEYNKKVMTKNGLKGWTALSKQLQETVLPISFNFAEEVERVREEAQRSGSLRGSRRMNSFEKFQQSSIRRTKNEKLNEDLDFIFRNEQFKRTYDSKRSRPQHSPPTHQASTAPPQIFRPFANGPESHRQMPSPIKSPRASKAPEPPTAFFPPKSTRKGPVDAQRRKEMRGVDLIVLAIIAALFLGLGEGMGRALKS